MGIDLEGPSSVVVYIPAGVVLLALLAYLGYVRHERPRQPPPEEDDRRS